MIPQKIVYMKFWLILLGCLGICFSTAAQDSLVMKYKYRFKYRRYLPSPVIPLQQYAQVFPMKNGLEEKEDTTTPDLLTLHKTWRSKSNKALGYQDFALIDPPKLRTGNDSLVFRRRQKYVSFDEITKRRRIKQDSIERSHGWHRAKGYKKIEIKDPYLSCTDKDDFRYTIPVLHEIDWHSLPQKETKDTIVQRRLFFTDSTLITIRDKQWKLWDVSYCIGANLPDTVNSTTFKWKYIEVELPKIRFSKSKYKIFSSKKKRMKVGRVCYTFSSPQRLFGTEEYVIKCTVKDRKKTYVQNLFLGKGSQLVFHDIVLNVLDVDDYGLLLNYQSTRGGN
jgi:hypothetical protein